MPGMLGTELITKLRETNNVAVIFLTAKDKDSEIVTRTWTLARMIT